MDKELKLSLLNHSIYHMPHIDWGLLSQAQQYYQKYFNYQETPFAVPTAYNALTKPHFDPSFFLSKGIFQEQEHELVGSAEQGFIYLALNQQLKSDRLFSISPCFRTENFDELRHPWFMKLELFHLASSIEDVLKIVDIAHEFFNQVHSGQYSIIKTSDISWDILLNNIEIGSYGLRVLKEQNLTFVYGTGLALPRFSQAVLADPFLNK